MRTKLFATVIMVLSAVSFCFSQPEHGGMKPPSKNERIKMVKERICQPLNLDKLQTEKVTSAFNDFFVEMDKLVDRSVKPPVRPEKSKVDSLAKIRDEKVKHIMQESKFTKYLELELAGRPKGPEDGEPHPN